MRGISGSRRGKDNRRRQGSPGGAVDSLDCRDGRVFAGAMTNVHHPSPNRQRMRGRATSCAVRVWTTPQRERTAGGIATTTGGPGNGDIDVEALAVMATHYADDDYCHGRRQEWAGADDEGNRQERADNDGERLGRDREVRRGCRQVRRVGRRGRQATRAGSGLVGSKRQTGPASNESVRVLRRGCH